MFAPLFFSYRFEKKKNQEQTTISLSLLWLKDLRKLQYIWMIPPDENWNIRKL